MDTQPPAHRVRFAPRETRERGFTRVPETCDTVRAALDHVKERVMLAYSIPLAEEATIDEIVSHAFLVIRDQVTQPFRAEQLILIQTLINHDLANDILQDPF